MRTPVVLLIALTSLFAADPARDGRWRDDLNYLAAQLPQRHPNLFYQTPRADFDKAVADLNAAIPNLSDTEVMVGLSAITALAGDAHTSLGLGQRESSFRLLPLRVRWFTDGLFVIAAQANYSRALRARVVEIGNGTTEQAYQAVTRIVSHENDYWVRELSPGYLMNADVLQALHVAPDSGSVRMVFEDAAGTRFALDIASLAPGANPDLVFAPDPAGGFTPLYQQHTDQNYWFTYIESSHTLYFAYNVCRDMPGLSFADFNNQLWAAFDSHRVERFIIDLRNNAGGNSSVIAPFFVSGNQRQQQFAATAPFAIVGHRTFSSGVLAAINIGQTGVVRIVGEPTGGKPNSYGDILAFSLPNSRLNVNYSTKQFIYPAYPGDAFMPDVNVATYSRDYFARHDPFMALVLGDAAGSPPAAGGPLAVLNAAGFAPAAPVAPGSIAAVFGDFSGVPSGDAATLPLPKQLNGVQLLLNDVPAPLLAVRPGQINFQVPYSLTAGKVAVQVIRNGAPVATGAARIAGTAPGVFVIDSLSPAQPGAVLDESSRVVGDSTPARSGRIIQIFATGAGAVTPAVEDGGAQSAQPTRPVRVFLGADQAEIVYSGLHPMFPGLWQINARIPDSLSVTGQVPMFIAIGSGVSNGVTIAVND